jgi:leucyl-tRNA synthetase
MFMGPLEQVKPWQTSGCEGVSRFLGRVWRLLIDEHTGEVRASSATPDKALVALHTAIKETTEGIEQLKFNTPVSRMMEFVNASAGTAPARKDALSFIKILSPYAPHLAEELWARMGCTEPLLTATWPVFDPDVLVEDTIEMVVQVMGKMRGRVCVPADADKDTVFAAAKQVPNVARHLEGKTIRKEIFVPGRLVNFVAN